MCGYKYMHIYMLCIWGYILRKQCQEQHGWARTIGLNPRPSHRQFSGKLNFGPDLATFKACV